MDELHRQLLEIGFGAGSDLGSCWPAATPLPHELIDRPSRDIDFATATALPLPEVVAGWSPPTSAGFTAEVVEATPRMARMIVTTAAATCEVDLLKEAIGPPAWLSIGPVLALDDAVGLKVRALHERAAHRDYIDIHAANAQLSWAELETRGARHTPGFSLEELANRLGNIDDLDDHTFAAYGLDGAAIAELRHWAVAWESDIRERIAAGEEGRPA